jgi:hypothetical protein
MSCGSIISVKEPLTPDAATALIKTIIREGQVTWSQHASDEMRADDPTMVDCVNFMRAGAVSEPAEFIRNTWRYRIHTPRIYVVVAFRSEQELAVVTAWRERP